MDSAKEEGQKEISAYLDRIEELEDGSERAVFLFEIEEDEFIEFVLPTELLPEGVDEGEYLTITLARAAEKTQAASDEARALLATNDDSEIESEE